MSLMSTMISLIVKQFEYILVDSIAQWSICVAFFCFYIIYLFMYNIIYKETHMASWSQVPATNMGWILVSLAHQTFYSSEVCKLVPYFVKARLAFIYFQTKLSSEVECMVQSFRDWSTLSASIYVFLVRR